MIYVISNIHGEMAKLCELIDKIELSEDDILYVLGDLVDKGDESMEVLCDLSMRTNVYPVMGEHDALAYEMLSGFDDMLKNGGSPDPEYVAKMQEWIKIGGGTTLEGFRALDADMKEGVLDYLADMAPYEIAVTDSGAEFLLVHAGIANFDPDTDLDDYAPEDFYTEALDMDKEYFGDMGVVVGHVPTKKLGSADSRIVKKGKNIAIDCGVYDRGALACICLDNGREFYV